MWTSLHLVRAESMSKTSLAKCFLCFWMLGMSTCKIILMRFYVMSENILKKKCGSAIRMRKVKMAVLAHLSKHIERLHHISLDLELKLDELLGQLLFCLPAQLQHLPVW